MPDTSSAVPDDLLRLEGQVTEQATACAFATAHLERSAAALVSSRSAGVGSIDLAALGRRLRRHVEDTSSLADRTGDVGHAFAVAGGAVGGTAVTLGDEFIEACLRLPDGRALTLAGFEAMTYAGRLRWLLRFLDRDLVPSDPNFRSVAGVLAAAHASGPHGLWADDAFRVADAALLESMQLGLVVAASGRAWRDRDDPRSRAVLGWVEYASTSGEDRAAAWAAAEEESVRYGEAVADRRGLRFDDDLEPFIRFSHVYRVAIQHDEQRALLAEIVASLDPIGLAALADDVREVIEARIDALFDLPLEPLVDWLRRTWFPFGPPQAISDGLDWLTQLPVTISFPPPWSVFQEAIELVTPGALAALLLDPAATPPGVVASVLDDVLGVRPPMTDPPASYYVGMLVDRRYLRGLPTHLDRDP